MNGPTGAGEDEEQVGTSIESMLATVADRTIVEPEVWSACIDALVECAAVCTMCADACLGENEVEPMRDCIRRDLDCADVCAATARIASRTTATDRDLVLDVLGTCIRFCGACRTACEQHAEHHDHCRVCAETCARCEEACKALIAAL